VKKSEFISLLNRTAPDSDPELQFYDGDNDQDMQLVTPTPVSLENGDAEGDEEAVQGPYILIELEYGDDEGGREDEEPVETPEQSEAAVHSNLVNMGSAGLEQTPIQKAREEAMDRGAEFIP
jgi:hypothetical protein